MMAKELKIKKPAKKPKRKHQLAESLEKCWVIENRGVLVGPRGPRESTRRTDENGAILSREPRKLRARPTEDGDPRVQGAGAGGRYVRCWDSQFPSLPLPPPPASPSLAGWDSQSRAG